MTFHLHLPLPASLRVLICLFGSYMWIEVHENMKLVRTTPIIALLSSWTQLPVLDHLTFCWVMLVIEKAFHTNGYVVFGHHMIKVWIFDTLIIGVSKTDPRLACSTNGCIRSESRRLAFGSQLGVVTIQWGWNWAVQHRQIEQEYLLESHDRFLSGSSYIWRSSWILFTHLFSMPNF